MKLIKGSKVTEVTQNMELLESNNKKIIYRRENWFKPFYINFNKAVYQVDSIIFYDENGKVFDLDRDYLVDNDFLALILDSEVKRVKSDKLDFTTNNNYIVINDRQYLSLDYKLIDLYINISALGIVKSEETKEENKDYIYAYKNYSFTIDNNNFKVKYHVRSTRKEKEILQRKIDYLKSLIDKYENSNLSDHELIKELEETRYQ